MPTTRQHPARLDKTTSGKPRDASAKQRSQATSISNGHDYHNQYSLIKKEQPDQEQSAEEDEDQMSSQIIKKKKVLSSD